MKKIIAVVIFVSIFVSGCAADNFTEQDNQYLTESINDDNEQESPGVINMEDFKGEVLLYAEDVHHVSCSSDNGYVEEEYIVYDSVTTDCTSEAENTVAEILQYCLDIEPKEPECLAEMILLGNTDYELDLYPVLYFVCVDSQYIYVLDFYTPLPGNDMIYQRKYGNDSTVVVRISKLIMPRDEDVYAYAAKYKYDVNIWTAYNDDSGYVGRPWISTISYDNVKKISELIKTMDKYMIKSYKHS